MKKILSIALSFILFFTIIPSITAEANDSASPDQTSEYGILIETTQYTDEKGSQITERIYYLPDSAMTKGSYGNGWYTNEKTVTWTNGDKAVFYAKGYFSWGGGNVTVTNPSGGFRSTPNSDYVTISNKSTTSGTGRYAGIFNKYAYVTFSFTAQPMFNSAEDYSVTIRVSESGNTI